MDHSYGKPGNLYCELNRDLRALGKAAPVARDTIINIWGPFMNFCIHGLQKCPTVAPGTLVWRARPEKLEELRKIYRLGAYIAALRPPAWTSRWRASMQTMALERSWS